MNSYPTIHGVVPRKMFGTRVPRDDDQDIPAVTEADIHQLRAVYEFDDVTANIIPEPDEQPDGTWSPYWTVQVYEGDFGGCNEEYGPFETVSDAVAHVKQAMDKLS